MKNATKMQTVLAIFSAIAISTIVYAISNNDNIITDISDNNDETDNRYIDIYEYIETAEIIYEEPEAEENTSISEDIEEEYKEAELYFIDTIYTVKNGDNLWSISNNFYGDGNLYYRLAEYNNLDPNKSIYSGTEIAIPTRETLSIYNMDPGTTIPAFKMEQEYMYGKRTYPVVDITIPDGVVMKNNIDIIDTSSYEYIGDFNITGYTPTCAHCCGGSTNSIGASGVKIIPGYSVATNANDFDFGTTLYIEGYGYYVVEDRGVGTGVIDIASPSHESCFNLTGKNIRVYIVK